MYSYIRTYNIPAIITNCSNNYGPRQHPEKLIPKLIYNILNNKTLPIYGKGLNSREWIYVDDHCEALIIVSKKEQESKPYQAKISNVNFEKKDDLVQSISSDLDSRFTFSNFIHT